MILNEGYEWMGENNNEKVCVLCVVLFVIQIFSEFSTYVDDRKLCD